MATKKKFIDVEVPLLDTEISLLGTPETLNKKTIKVDLTRKLRGKSLDAVFQIFNKNNSLYALPKSLNLMKFYIIRMMRKRASYVEDSFSAPCKDVTISIKPFLITRKNVSRAVRNNLRKTSREFLINYVKDKNYLELCKELVYGQLQKEMLPKLKKIYPLSFCEIRVFETKQIENVVYEKQEKKKEETHIVSEQPIEEQEKTQAEEMDEENEKKAKQEKETQEKIETPKKAKIKKEKKSE